MRLIAEALRHVAQTGIVYYEAELHRLDAELRLRLDTPDEQRAEVSFRRALETAGRQQAKSWELRAATSLARLLRDQNRSTEAIALLTAIYNRFTEGFETADLKTAKALIDGFYNAEGTSQSPLMDAPPKNAASTSMMAA